MITAVYLSGVGGLRFWASKTPKKSATDWSILLASVALGVLILLYGARIGLLYPIIVNLGFFAVFYSSLFAASNFIQRIAERIENARLDAIGIKYTRQVTKIWCAVFLLNILVSTFLAYKEWLDAWTLYNGVIAYFIIATLFTGERLVRDRILQKMRSRRCQ